MYRIFSLIMRLFTTSAAAEGQAVARLMKGNERYVQDALQHPNHDQKRRADLIAKQEPFAVIVGCADSRVPPELIFDQGAGDLFVVRVAGNVIGPVWAVNFVTFLPNFTLNNRFYIYSNHMRI